MRNSETLVDEVREALRTVIDPEIGFNIVDLGLVYGIDIDTNGRATITMTTTTRGCPATGFLRNGVEEAATLVDGVGAVEVLLVYDPPWTPDMMNEVPDQWMGGLR